MKLSSRKEATECKATGRPEVNRGLLLPGCVALGESVLHALPHLGGGWGGLGSMGALSFDICRSVT